MAALTALTSLSLRGCSGLSDGAPARLAPLGQLRHLALGGPAVTDAALVQCIVLAGAHYLAPVTAVQGLGFGRAGRDRCGARAVHRARRRAALG